MTPTQMLDYHAFVCTVRLVAYLTAPASNRLTCDVTGLCLHESVPASYKAFSEMAALIERVQA